MVSRVLAEPSLISGTHCTACLLLSVSRVRLPALSASPHSCDCPGPVTAFCKVLQLHRVGGAPELLADKETNKQYSMISLPLSSDAALVFAREAELCCVCVCVRTVINPKQLVHGITEVVGALDAKSCPTLLPHGVCGLPFPSSGDLPNPGAEPGSPAPHVDSLLTKPPGKPVGFWRLASPASRLETQGKNYCTSRWKACGLEIREPEPRSRPRAVFLLQSQREPVCPGKPEGPLGRDPSCSGRRLLLYSGCQLIGRRPPTLRSTTGFTESSPTSTLFSCKTPSQLLPE